MARLVDFLGEACIASKRDYALENLSLLRKTYSDVGKPKTMRGFTSLGDVGFYGRRAGAPSGRAAPPRNFLGVA